MTCVCPYSLPCCATSALPGCRWLHYLAMSALLMLTTPSSLPHISTVFLIRHIFIGLKLCWTQTDVLTRWGVIPFITHKHFFCLYLWASPPVGKTVRAPADSKCPQQLPIRPLLLHLAPISHRDASNSGPNPFSLPCYILPSLQDFLAWPWPCLMAVVSKTYPKAERVC